MNRTLPEESGRDLARRARELVPEAFSEVRVDLRKLGHGLFLKFKRCPGRCESVQGAISFSDQLNLFGSSNGTVFNYAWWHSGSRFTLAHEIAHQLYQMSDRPVSAPNWSAEDWRLQFDTCAAHILLPDSALRTLLPTEIELSPQLLIEASARARVSLSLLISRVGELSRQGGIRLLNGAIIAAPAVSARKKEHYAPRVITSCLPRNWYLPNNKRLSSLGARALEEAFWIQDAWKERHSEGELRVWDRIQRRREAVPVRFVAKVFTSKVASRRVMLAIVSSRPNRESMGEY